MVLSSLFGSSSWLGRPLLIAVGVFFCSCVSTGIQKIDPNMTYDHDAAVTVDGIVYTGVGVLPFKPVGEYKVIFEAKKPFDIILFDTCTKNLRAERSYNMESSVRVLPFWSYKITDKKRYAFSYSQDQQERAKEACQLQFQAFNQEEGKHSFALLDIQDPRYTLSAELSCNTDHGKVIGVSMCDNQEQKFVDIVFTEPVTVTPDKKTCATPETKQMGKHFNFHIQPGICVYSFLGLDSGKKHRLTIVGWQDFIKRF